MISKYETEAEATVETLGSERCQECYKSAQERHIREQNKPKTKVLWTAVGRVTEVGLPKPPGLTTQH